MLGVCFDGVYNSKSEFLRGIAMVNKIEIHSNCTDARFSCDICTKAMANVLGISYSVFLMLRSYLLRTELGEAYIHPVD